jgi:hypothetical protein
MTVPTGLSITGSPITSSGTLAVTLASGYVIPTQTTLDGKVPYTGATANVALGIYDLSLSDLAVNNIKANNSGTNDIGSSTGFKFRNIYATSFVTTSGTSSQFVKGDGTLDSNTYLTTSSASSTYVPYTGATTTLNLGSNYALTNSGFAVLKTASATFGAAFINQNSSGVNRFGLGILNAETGSGNTGSDLYWYSYADNGSIIGSILSIKRSTGVVSFSNLTNFPNIAVNQIQANNNGTDDIGDPSGNKFRNVYATKFVTTSGTSSQFVKGDGTLDSSTYLTTSSASSTYLPYTGAIGSLEMGTGSYGIQAGKFILFNRAGSNTLGSSSYQAFVDAAQNNGVYFQLDASNNLGIFGKVSGATTLVASISATGSFNGTSFVPTGSTIPTNGMYLSAANTLDFSTNSVNRLSISSAGIITTPNQVSFKGYIISNASIAKGSYVTIPYNGEEYDTQSNYNTTTYKFTAPVAGKYLFTVNFNAYSLDDTATLKVALVINSASFRFLYGFANLPTGNTGDTNISGSDILNLSAGNTVEVRVFSDGSGTFNMSQDTTYNSFSGHLL